MSCDETVDSKSTDSGPCGAFLVELVAVIGAGPAGRAFALRCVAAGFAVVLEDVMPSKLRRMRDEYADTPDGRLRYALTVEDAVREADLAVDFVPDELESKLEIFSMIDRMAPPRTVICTPIHALSITDLASCTYRAERCMALRGELTGGEITLVRSRFLADDVQAAVETFFAKLGMHTHVVEDAEEPMLVKNAQS